MPPRRQHRVIRTRRIVAADRSTRNSGARNRTTVPGGLLYVLTDYDTGGAMLRIEPAS
jgi:hypothetical protein